MMVVDHHNTTWHNHKSEYLIFIMRFVFWFHITVGRISFVTLKYSLSKVNNMLLLLLSSAEKKLSVWTRVWSKPLSVLFSSLQHFTGQQTRTELHTRPPHHNTELYQNTGDKSLNQTCWLFTRLYNCLLLWCLVYVYSRFKKPLK